jgi:hypothetical protein
MQEAFEGGKVSDNFLRELNVLNRLTLKAAEYAHLQLEYEAWAARKEGKSQ